jgi:hypothetical protein
MLGLLFTLPSSPEILSAIGSTTSPVVSDFLPMVYLVAGIGLALTVVIILVRLFMPHASTGGR